jgi:hypothetical protein
MGICLCHDYFGGNFRHCMVDFPPQTASLTSFSFILGFILYFFSTFDPKCDDAPHHYTHGQ